MYAFDQYCAFKRLRDAKKRVKTHQLPTAAPMTPLSTRDFIQKQAAESLKRARAHTQLSHVVVATTRSENNKSIK